MTKDSISNKHAQTERQNDTFTASAGKFETARSKSSRAGAEANKREFGYEIINKEFFLQDTLKAAKGLLGCVLVRNNNGVIQKGRIVETEAYTQEDPSCHAYKGVTKRSEPMFEEGGIAYVYFTYGMYHCFNIVTEEKGRGCAILVRALEPVENIENTNGPGKLCREMNIDRTLNKADVCSYNSPLYILKGKKVPSKNIVTTTRIGIKQAADYPWRFYVKDNKYISKK